MFNISFSQHRGQIEQEKVAIFSRKYLVVLVLVITAISLNCFYSIAMIIFTTFTLAYLTKGSRCK